MVNINICHSFLYLFYISLQFISLANAAGVSFDFSRVKISKENEILPIHNNALNKRANAYQEYVLKNEKSFYMINFTLGTPEQDVIGVLLDTGSSDLWVSSKKNKLCEEIGCERYGTYDPDISSTWKYNNSKFSLTYADKTYAKGDWGMDIIHIGDISIPNLNFAVALDATSEFGVFGIGFDTLESAPEKYINFPGALVMNGLINSQAYSIFLNDANADSGSILFGAVDHSKYVGTLSTVPIVSTTRTAVRLTGFSAEDNGCETDAFTPYHWYSTAWGQLGHQTSAGLFVLLDTGTTLTMLPKSFVEGIAEAFNAIYDKEQGYYFHSCNGDGLKVNFKFSCATISAPLSNFLTPSYYEDGSPVYLPNGEPQCFFDFITTSDIPILGESFLRSAYVVMDLDNKQASLAQAKSDPSATSEIEEIQIGPDGIPRDSTAVCKAAKYSSCQPSPRTSSSSSTSSVPTSSNISPSDISSVLSSSSSIISTVSSTSTEEAHSTPSTVISSYFTSRSAITSSSFIASNSEEAHSNMNVVSSSLPSTTAPTTSSAPKSVHSSILSASTSDATSDATSAIPISISAVSRHSLLAVVSSSSSVTSHTQPMVTLDSISSYSTPTSLVSYSHDSNTLGLSSGISEVQSQPSTTAIAISSVELSEAIEPIEVIETSSYTTETFTSCETIINSDTTGIVTLTYTTVVPCPTIVADSTFEATTEMVDTPLYITETTISYETIINNDTTEVITLTYTTAVPCPSQSLVTDSTFEVTTEIVGTPLYITETTISCETIINNDTTEVITQIYTTVVPCSTTVHGDPDFEETTPTVQLAPTVIIETTIDIETTVTPTYKTVVTHSTTIPAFKVTPETLQLKPWSAVITNTPSLLNTIASVSSNLSTITPITNIEPNFASLIRPYMPIFICMVISYSLFFF